MFSLLLLLIWTLGINSRAPMWVPASISTYGQMKVIWWCARYSSVWLWNQAIRHPHLLPREKSGDLSLALAYSSKVKSLAIPKISPLIKILTFLLPFPPFLFPKLPFLQALSNPSFLPSLFQSHLTCTAQISMHQFVPGNLVYFQHPGGYVYDFLWVHLLIYLL